MKKPFWLFDSETKLCILMILSRILCLFAFTFVPDLINSSEDSEIFVGFCALFLIAGLEFLIIQFLIEKNKEL